MKPGWVVLFDWDGTLVNSLGIKIRNAGLLFSVTFGADPRQVEGSYRQHSGIPRRQLFEAICTDLSLPVLGDASYQTFSQRFTEMNMVTLTNSRNPGVLPKETADVLMELRDQGYPIYISSAADPQEIHHIVEAVGLGMYFHEIMGSIPGFSKGEQHVEHVCQIHNVPISHIAFVGDDISDIQLGRAAGVLTIAKAGTHTFERLSAEGPDYVIGSLGELPPLLAQLRQPYGMDHIEHR